MSNRGLLLNQKTMAAAAQPLRIRQTAAFPRVSSVGAGFRHRRQAAMAGISRECGNGFGIKTRFRHAPKDVTRDDLRSSFSAAMPYW
jgi:hypothetical protein